MRVSALFVCTISLAASGSAQTQSDSLKELVNQLANEVRTLKSDVRRLQLEDQRQRISPLELELQKIAGERQRLEMRESNLYKDVAQLDQHLGNPALADADRAEIEATKMVMMTNELPALRAEREKLIHREVEVQHRLTGEQQLWNELVAAGR